MRIDVAAMTDVGLKRDHNEDAYLVWDLGERKPVKVPTSASADGESSGVLLAVSDGMGGARSGEVASRIVVETLEAYTRETFQSEDVESVKEWLSGGVRAANRRVHDRSASELSVRGMGATLTVAVLQDSILSIAHVGDSRAYLFRDDRLRQLTMDQTHVQELVSIGQISAAEARTHRRRNLLLQAIGTGEDVEIDEFDVAVEGGDRIVICSDGLHGFVEDDEIAGIVATDDGPDPQCRRLVELANQRGGDDNITVIVAHLA